MHDATAVQISFDGTAARSCHSGRSDLLLLQCRRQRLGQLVRLVLILDHECVKVPAAPDFELRLDASALDLHGLRVLPAGHLQELPDLRDLLGHCERFWRTLLPDLLSSYCRV